ncbi:MAG: exo-alpha-sialidase [Planctomycetes bacterium]|nr:exo-alpha-sialidase [Planctomycetota bacterium]
MKRSLRNLVAIGALGSILVGCGGSGGGGGGHAPTTNLAGSVVAGKVSNGVLKVFRVNSDRSLELLETSSTDASGQYTLSIGGDGPFLLVAGQGTYRDEASGTNFSLGSIPALSTLDSLRPRTLEALIGSGAGSGAKAISLTPLSTFAARRAVTASKTDPNALAEAQVLATNLEIALEMGLGNTDPRTLVPLDPTDSADSAAILADPNAPEARLGFVLSALSQSAANRGLSDPLDLVEALARDFEDGVFNGQDGAGSAVQLSGASLTPSAGTVELADSALDFLSGSQNASGATSSDLSGLTDALSTQDVAPAGVNKAPSFAPSVDQAGLTNVQQSLALSGVTSGPNEAQTLSFSANSDNAAIVSTFAFSGTGSTRSLTFTPVGVGVARITISVQDDGGAANGGVDRSSQTVVLTVTASSAPAIASSAPSGAIAGAAFSYTLTATGAPAPTLSAAGLPAWLSFDPASGVLSGTPALSDVGVSGSITLDATNGIGSAATQVFSLTVQQAPTITSTPTTSAPPGVSYSYTVAAIGSPSVAVSFSNLPGWLTATGPTITGVPSVGDAGFATVIIQATNTAGADTQSLTLDVNVPPTLNAGPDRSVAEAAPLALALTTFTDSAGETFSNPTINWGDGASNVGTLGVGTIAWPPHTYPDNGTYTVTTSLSDHLAAVGSDSLVVTVSNVAPVLVSGPDRTAAEAASLTLAPTIFSDALADTHLNATIDWGDGSPTSVGALGTGTITWPSHTYADNGTYTLTTSLTDDDGGTGTDAVVATIANVAPVLSPGPAAGVDKGIALTLPVTTFVDTPADTHSAATIDWGDGNSDVGAISTSSITWPAHTYTTTGTYTASLSLTDDDGGIGTASLTITVANQPPVLSAGSDRTITETSTLTLVATTFTDNPTDTHNTPAIAWGDGNSDVGTIGSGTVTWPSHTYADDGPYAVTTSLTDSDGAIGTDTLLVTVSNVAPILSATAESSNEGQALSVAPTLYSDAPGDTHLNATIDWGDGSPTATGTISAVGTKSISWPAHTYADNGTFAATASLTDDDGGTGSTTFSVTVSNVAPLVSAGSAGPVAEGATLILPITTFSDVPADTHSNATIDWGDGNNDVGAIGTGTVTWPTHAYADNGSYTVTISVSDDDGGSGSGGLTVAVSNAAPLVSAGPDTVVATGALASLAPATFTDPGSADTHTASVNWGDGVSEAAIVTSLTVTGSHTYGAQGTYFVTITVSDDDGASASDSFALIHGDPFVSSVIPDTGSPAGGTPITISGTRFVPSATVTIGGLAAGVTFVDSGTLTCVTPAGALGPADVIVVTPATAGSTTVTGGFSYEGFEANVQLPNSPLANEVDQSGAVAAVGTGAIYTAWRDARGDSTGTSGDVFFARSTDGGLTWSANLELNDDVIGNQNMSSPSLAVGPSGEIGCVWQDDRNGLNSRRIYFTRSTDGGLTWSANVQVTSESVFSLTLAIGPNGDLYCAWGSSGLKLSKSADGGATWSAPALIAGGTNDNRSNPRLAVNGTRVVCVSEAPPPNYDIGFVQSTDGGATWTSEVFINDDGDTSRQLDPEVALLTSGAIAVAWEDRRTGNYDVFFTRSTDGGATWATNTRIDDGPGAANQESPSLVAGPAGQVVCVWEDFRTPANNYDIYVARSSDEGATWSAGARVDDATGTRAQRSASLAIDSSGNLSCAWIDTRNRWSDDVYVTQSTDGGVTWSANTRPNDDPGRQTDVALALTQSGLVACLYTDSRNYHLNLDVTNTDVFVSSSGDGGSTWGADLSPVVDGSFRSQNTPSLAGGLGNTLFAAWRDERLLNTGLFFSSSADGGATWSANQKLKNTVASGYSIAALGTEVVAIWRGTNVELRYSADGGASWSATATLSDSLVGSRQDTVVAIGSGVIFSAWYDTRDGFGDVYSTVSTDGGVTWSANVKINSNTGVVGANKPTVAVGPTGDLICAWTENTGGNSSVNFSRSTDGGATWSTSVQIKTNAGTLFKPNVSVDAAGNVLCVYVGLIGGDKGIHLGRSTDNGATWTNTRLSDAPVSGNVFDVPKVRVAGGYVHVAWVDGRKGRAFAFTARGYFKP